MTLAVMEGVAFALRDCIEVAKSNGLDVKSAKICGGGAKSAIWKKIIANVFGLPISVLNIEEGPAYGAAMLAMVGAREYDTVEQAVSKMVSIKDCVLPNMKICEKYNARYQIFKSLYPALQLAFTKW